MILRRFLSTSLPPTIRQLLSAPATAPPSPVNVTGWVKSVRRQKKVAFAVISDGSSEGGLQAVFPHADLAKRLENGASVRLGGVLTPSPGPRQDQELRVESVEVLGECDPTTYPIQKQSLSVEYLREHSHLRARTDFTASMIRLRDGALRALHTHFENLGFCYVHTPILTSNDCEGAGEAFRVAPVAKPPSAACPQPAPSEFFGRPAYLTVSSQLHLEALASAVARTYTLSPCFRAEPSQTSRHLAEFWMLEAEWAFTRDVDDVCGVLEGALKHVLHATHDAAAQLLARAGTRGAAVAAQLERARAAERWPRIPYADAVAALARHHGTTAAGAFRFAPAQGRALQSEHERWLADALVGGPVFVTDYPAALKPFYMRANADGETVACFDLLVPQLGELVGGSLREERHDRLGAALDKHGLDREEYGWYLDLRRYGGAPHGGFGLGFERLISWIGGIENVRECIPMPRWAGRMLL